MGQDSRAVGKAHQNLWQRIDRCLAGMEEAGRQPTWCEGLCILKALACVELGEYAEGERAMRTAEFGAREPCAGADRPTTTVQVLRQRFAAIGRAAESF